MQLNKPKQLNTIHTSNPDLVILLQPSVRKRGGSLQGPSSQWTAKEGNGCLPQIFQPRPLTQIRASGTDLSDLLSDAVDSSK